jgi:hypothetical protein
MGMQNLAKGVKGARCNGEMNAVDVAGCVDDRRLAPLMAHFCAGNS